MSMRLSPQVDWPGANADEMMTAANGRKDVGKM